MTSNLCPGRGRFNKSWVSNKNRCRACSLCQHIFTHKHARVHKLTCTRPCQCDLLYISVFLTERQPLNHATFMRLPYLHMTRTRTRAPPLPRRFDRTSNKLGSTLKGNSCVCVQLIVKETKRAEMRHRGMQKEI